MDLVAIEDRLQELASELDRPFRPNSDADDLCMALGRRARELHRGFVTCIRAGAIVAARALVRPAVETNVLLRYLRIEPDLRTRLWVAEGGRQSQRWIADLRRNPPPTAQRLPSLPTDDELDEMRRDLAKLRNEARQAGQSGLSPNGPLLPPVREQVEQLDTPEAWQAYNMAYTPLSSEQHIGRQSFQQSFRHELDDGSVIHHDSHEIRPGERELGSSVFASTLLIVGSWLDLGFMDEANAIRAELVGET